MAAIERVYRIDEIEPNLLIGSWQVSTDRECLEDNDIKVILSLALNKKPEYIMNIYDEYKIIPYEIRIDNTACDEIQKWFPRIFMILNHYAEQKVNILVHCNDGYNVSVIAVAAYLIIRTYVHTKDFSTIKKPIVDDVMRYVRSKRKYAKPLPYFVAALRAFEISIRNKECKIKDLLHIKNDS